MSSESDKPDKPDFPFDMFDDAMFLSEESGGKFYTHRPFGRSETGFLAGRSFQPAADVYETAYGLVISIDIPGVRREEVDVEVEGRHMIVRGKRDYVRESSDEETVRLERGYGSFRRVFEIPQGVKQEAISAKLDKGVLTIFIPCGKETSEVRIEVED